MLRLSRPTAIARVQFNLVKREVGYQGRFSRTESLPKTEQYRQELVASGETATKKLLNLSDFQARVALRAIALRVAQAQTQVFAVDYKHVNDLSIYEGNSLEARWAYYSAFDAALQKTVVLNDSLRAARRDFADEFNLLLDTQEMRVIDQWLSVQHRNCRPFSLPAPGNSARHPHSFEHDDAHPSNRGGRYSGL